MKLCATLLKFVLVVVFVEAVFCAGVGSTAERVCPTEARDQEYKSIFKKVERLSTPCVEELQMPRSIKNENTTTEQIRTFFEGVCQKKTRFQECLSEKASNLEVCPDTTILKVFNIMREFLERKFESGCAQNGERLVNIFSGIRNSKPDGKQLEKCFSNFAAIAKNLGANKVDISSKLFILHELITSFKKCFSSIEFDPLVRAEFDYFIDETITTMQCIHPQDGTLVVCASLDAALINFTNVCDIKTQHNTLSAYDVLEADAFRWFEDIIAQDNHDDGEEDITRDNEKLRDDCKYFCSFIDVAENHKNELKVFSQLCLNETEKKEFNLLVETIMFGLVHACVDDGKRISDTMFEVYRLKRTSPDHDHAVLDCINHAKSTRSQIDEHKSSSKNMRFYHELEAFKVCFIPKLQGDQTSVVAATSLIDEMLGIVHCVNPEDGSTVLCASLMHDHSHSHSHSH